MVGRASRSVAFEVLLERHRSNRHTSRTECTDFPNAVLSVAAVSLHIDLIRGVAKEVRERDGGSVIDDLRGFQIGIQDGTGRAIHHNPFRLIAARGPHHFRRSSRDSGSYRMNILYVQTVGNIINLHIIQINVVGHLRGAEGHILTAAGIATGPHLAAFKVKGTAGRGERAHTNKRVVVIRGRHYTHLDKVRSSE